MYTKFWFERKYFKLIENIPESTQKFWFERKYFRLIENTPESTYKFWFERKYFRLIENTPESTQINKDSAIAKITLINIKQPILNNIIIV